MIKVSTINEDISLYIFGKPIDTDSVILTNEEKRNIDINDIKYVNVDTDNRLIYKLDEDDIVYGLGENVRGLNKRGWIYTSFCSDEYSHCPDKKSLYGAHNFIIVYGKENFGIFVDSPSKVTFDIGYTNHNEIKIINENSDFKLYIIEGDSLNDIVKNFRILIGKSYIPPRWAFGYGQSKWGYGSEEEVREIVKKFQDKDIPLEMLYLDIDYMKDFKDFTVDKANFPNFDGLIKDLKEDGIKAIPIVDAGVKIEKGYETYEEGLKGDYFCVDKDGKPFVAAVWPGKVHFPDFLNKEARKWFGRKYKTLTDMGIEGFWNDMNEPAIFYSEEGLKKAFEKAEEYKDKNIDIFSFFDLRDTFSSVANSMDDYKSIYHKVDGKLVSHYDVHNLYGFNMTRSASEGLDEIFQNKRYLLFSRASTIGMHRYGGMWTGDCYSWWEHIEMNLKMLPSLNMCGFMFIGSDTGGFGADTTSDLLIRWNQLSLFTPLYRNHSSRWSRSQEPFAFDKETEDIVRNIIKFRYSLIPYLYSEFMKSVKDDSMYFKPLTFEYGYDPKVKEVEDQLIVGDSIMIAPIYKQNTTGRYIYLPENMLLCSVDLNNKFKFKLYTEGYNFFEYGMDEIVFFIRNNKMIPIADSRSKVDDVVLDELNLIAFVEDKAEYYLYDDDGISKSEGNRIKFTVEKINDKYEFNVQGDVNKKIRKVNLKIIDIHGKEINLVKVI